MKAFSSIKAALLLAVACVCAAAAAGNADLYVRRNLVSNGPHIPAENNDPNLVNAWGIAFNPFGVVWVNDAGTGLSTLYDGDGHPQSLVVRIPPATGSDEERSEPTGIVFYGGTQFVVSGEGTSAPARFIFASEDGGISAWAPQVNLNNAILVAETPGAIYKGLAISADGERALIYATDFFNAKIDVFDSSFQRVTMPRRAFRDPDLPRGFAPFGIQAINGDIYVTYGKQNAERDEEVKGRGLGIVSVFRPDGTFIRRLVRGGALNAPWGLALAPAGFGEFGNRLLVGNFGDGLINAYDIATGRHVGRLRGTDRRPIQIDGLWGLAFGNGLNHQPVDTLFFTAGPNDEEDGLYGRLDVARDRRHDDAIAPNSGIQTE